MRHPNRQLFRLSVLALAIVLMFAATGRTTVSVQAQAQDKPLADSGFRAAKDGFGFQNYGDDIKVTNLTSVEMRRLFGDAACASNPKDDGSCTLTPPVQQAMEQLNTSMAGGHCQGMAVLSEILKIGKAKADDFGAASPTDLKLTDNAALQREIAFWFSIQSTTRYAQTIDAQLNKYPTSNAMVDALAQGLADGKDAFTIGFWQPGYKGGHAVTPYAVIDKGDDTYWVMIYDNNFPKEERHFVFNRKTGQWSYFAAANPNEPGSEYQGDDSTKTFVFMPISLNLEAPFPCSACAGGGSGKASGLALAETQYNQVMLSSTDKANNADLLIEDKDGHQLGFVKGKFINQIPGALYIPQTSSGTNDDSPEPVYYIPVGITFTITLDGSALKQPEVANVSLIGPGHDIAIENIKMAPGEADIMAFSPDGKSLYYKPSSSEAPDITVGVQQAGADYAFYIKGFDLDKDGIVNVKLDTDKGQLSVNTLGSSQPAVYALQIDRIDKTSDQTFYHDGLELAPGATALIDYAKWDGKGDLSIQVDTKSDGTPDQTVTEPNQPVK